MMPLTEERRRGGRGRVAFAPDPMAEQVLDVAATAQLLSGELTSDVAAREYRQRNPWPLYAVLGTLLIAYLISLIVRSPDQHWLWLDGWAVTALEFVASAICILKGLQDRPGRAVPLILGCSLMAWTLGHPCSILPNFSQAKLISLSESQ